MRRLLSRRPSPAMIVALIALFVALAGGAYAAVKLPKNSVGSAQLRKGAVTPTKISTATKAALAAAIPKGATGPAGPRGVAGARGATGSNGARGAAGPKGDTGERGEIGPKGDIGPQGPGAKTLTLNATVSEGASPASIGTLLGVEFSAECSIPTGTEATLMTVAVLPSDGSLSWDAGIEESLNGAGSAESTSLDLPVGAITTPRELFRVEAGAGGKSSDLNAQIVELAPGRGYLNVHLSATTVGAQTCHVSVMGFPSE